MLYAITMVHNEMPLLPLTLANLLSQGVDRILIADHNSTDGALTWLRAAAKTDERITVFAHHNPALNQAAVISSLARLAAALGATWIVPFDADEFWIAADPSLHLSDVLAAAGRSGVPAIRVKLENFAAPWDCNDFRLTDLSRFTHRFAGSDPVPVTDDLSVYQDGIRAFIACPWPDKLIIRSAPNVLVGPGAHTAPSTIIATEDAVSEHVRCLHLPLRSRRTLEKKAAHGQLLASSGYPKWHGWQSQMLVSIDHGRDLDRIWAANSYPVAGRDASAITNEALLADNTLRDLYIKLSTHPLLHPLAISRASTEEGVDRVSTSWLAVAEALMLEAETPNAERLAALGMVDRERRTASAECARRLAVERDLESERSLRMRAERELDSERVQRMAAERDLESERSRRTDAERRLAFVVGSRLFRYRAWVRGLARRVRMLAHNGRYRFSPRS
jgi:hypothetical protein